jgi:hypothetical protein
MRGKNGSPFELGLGSFVDSRKELLSGRGGSRLERKSAQLLKSV